MEIHKRNRGTSNMAAVATSSSSWAASLPAELIFLILDKLFELTDHVRFAAVCKGWKSLAQDYHTLSPWRSRTPVPMLMILKKQPEETHRKAVLYSVSEDKVYNSFKFKIPSRRRYHDGMIYSGGDGWLARFPVDIFPKPLISRITLLNPFRSQGTSFITLPNFNFLLHGSIRSLHKCKVILSGDPTLNPENYVVILLCWYDKYNSELAFFRGGQESTWTRFSVDKRYTDAVIYRGRGYAFRFLGGIYDAVTTFNVKISYNPHPTHDYCCQRRHDDLPKAAYLVESTEGDLLCVRRYFKRETSTTGGPLWRTERFNVFKLVLNDKRGYVESQVEVESIGDDALFLGNNSQSVSVLASKHAGCQPDCIYYTDDWICIDESDHEHDDNVPLDMGIFNMKDGTITQLCPQISWNEHVLRPLWFTPTFTGLSLVSS